MPRKEETENEAEDVEEFSLSDLQDFEVGQGVELGEFDKKEIKLAGVQIIEVQSKYDEHGKEVKGGKTVTVKKLKVFSEPVTTFDAKDGRKIDIRASELFSLRYEDDKGYGVSNSPKSKINRLLKSLKLPVGLDGVKKIGGQRVVMKLISNDDGSEFLGFYY